MLITNLLSLQTTYLLWLPQALRKRILYKVFMMKIESMTEGFKLVKLKFNFMTKPKLNERAKR